MENRLLLTKLESLMSALKEIKDLDCFDKDSKKAVKDLEKGLKDIEHDIKKIRKEVNGNK